MKGTLCCTEKILSHTPSYLSVNLIFKRTLVIKMGYSKFIDHLVYNEGIALITYIISGGALEI